MSSNRGYAALKALVIVCGVLAVRPAAAEGSRVLLVDADQELASAVRTTLSAWQTSVLIERIAGPGNTMPGSADRARRLAALRGVEAVVWISRSEDGFALWMYDKRQDRVAARRLPTPPPFDEATAASVALAIKTLLRHSDVPPPAERLKEVSAPRWLTLSVLAGVRPNATSHIAPEARMGLGLAAWPWQDAATPRLGAGLELMGGTGVPLRQSNFTGRWNEVTVSLTLHGRLPFSSSLDVTFVPSFGLGLTRVEGTVLQPPHHASEQRVNAVAAVDAELGYQLSPVLRPALRLGLMRPFPGQAYQVRGESVLEVSELAMNALIALEIGLL